VLAVLEHMDQVVGRFSGQFVAFGRAGEPSLIAPADQADT